MGYKSYKSIKEAYDVVEGIAKKVVRKYGNILERSMSDTWVTGFSLKENVPSNREMYKSLYNFILDSLSEESYGVHNIPPERLQVEKGELLTVGTRYKKVHVNGNDLKVPLYYSSHGVFVYTKRCGVSCLVSDFYIRMEEDRFFFGITVPNIGSIPENPDFNLPADYVCFKKGSIPEDRVVNYGKDSSLYCDSIGCIGFDRGSPWHNFSRWNEENKKEGTWYCCDALEKSFIEGKYKKELGKAYSYLNKF